MLARPRHRRATVVALVTALGIGVGLAPPTAGAAGQRSAYARSDLDLRPARPQEADKLVAVFPDPAVTRAPRKAVTDLMLVVRALGAGRGDVTDIESALAAPNAEPPPPRLFAVRLVAVVGGRLQHHGAAVCGGWQQDRSRCRLVCDGGGFDLMRRLTAEGPTFRMLVGGDALDEGLRVSSCDGSGAEVRLVPKAGGEAEVVLQAD